MKKLLILLLFTSCAGNYQDLTEATIDQDVITIVNEIKDYALQYNAILFHERMKYIDVVWSDSDQGKALYEIATQPTENDLARAFCNMTSENERVIVLKRENFEKRNDNTKLRTLLHEYYHAVSDDCNSSQHINDIIKIGTKIVPLSLMNGAGNYYGEDFDEYFLLHKDFYLRTFFGSRLDRTYKEE